MKQSEGSTSPSGLVSSMAFGDDALRRYREPWQRAYVESGEDNPFLSWEWISWYSRQSGRGESLRLFLVHYEGRLICIAPMQDRRGTLVPFADSRIADYGEVLVVGPDRVSALSEVLRAMVRVADVVEIGPLREVPDSKESWRLALNASGLPSLREVLCLNPYVCPSTDANASASIAKKLRQELRTTRNHLERKGGWAFRVADTGEVAREMLEALFAFHTRRQQSKAGRSIFSDPEIRHFFHALIDHGGGLNGLPHVSAIEHDGRFVSVAIGLQTPSRYYYWIPSFDPELRHVSVGKLHILSLLDECRVRRRVFDFMGGDEAYKWQWTDTAFPVVRVRLYRGRGRYLTARAEREMLAWMRERKRRSPVLSRLWLRLSKFNVGGSTA